MPESQESSNVVSLEERARQAPTWGKAQILANVNKVETPYFPEAQANIPIRRLGSGEWAEAEAMQARGILIEGNPDPETFDETDPNAAKNAAGLKMSIDVEKATLGESDSRHQVVAYALSVNGENWTKEEAAKIPNVALIRAIARKALELSGVSAEAQAEIRNFREQRDGGESGVAGDEGASTGTDATGNDSSTGDVSANSDEQGGATS